MTIMTTLMKKFNFKLKSHFVKVLKILPKKKWLGPIGNLKNKEKMYEAFFELKPIGLYDDKLALVTKVKNDRIEVYLKINKKLSLSFKFKNN